MEFSEHGSSVAPYVVRTLRRQLLGPDTVGTIKIKALLDETAPQDTAPRPVELNPDSAAARALEDSIRRATPTAGRGRLAPAHRTAVRGPTVDRQLLLVSAGLIVFGLLTLYSAGQTDVPDARGGVWHRQFVWVGIGIVAAVVVFQRLAPAPGVARAGALRRRVFLCWCWCCWSAPARAPPQSSNSWLSIGGHQIGQPSELAKVATVLMLARYLSSRREPPRSLRDLLVPGHHRRRPLSPGAQAARPGQRASCSSGSCSPCCSGPGSGRGSCSCWRRPD